MAAVSDNFGMLLDPGRLERDDTVARRAPFPFIVAFDQLPRDAQPALATDFPRYAGAGFFPYDPADCGPSINRLVADLTGPSFAHELGARLGVPDLASRPTLVTLCRALNSRHGTVHTDSLSKVVTALLYLAPSWPDTSAGCLRFLARQDNLDDLVVPEVKPLYGTIAAFRRTENSWHGHVPFEGERHVIQVAWLVDEEAKSRKTRRGRLSRFVKWLTGALDRAWGRRRP
jgi:hypothetical protein